MVLVSLQLAQTPETREMIYAAAQSHLIVDEYFLIPGGIGIIVTAIFLDNVRHVAIAGVVQLIGFVYVITISVVKPWGKLSKLSLK